MTSAASVRAKAQAHASFCPGDRLKGLLGGESASAGIPDFPEVSESAA